MSPSFRQGWDLGAAQGNAVGGLGGFIVLAALGHWVPAFVFLALSAAGVWLWASRFDMALRITDRKDSQ